MASRRQKFITLPIHDLDKVSVQLMTQLVNDAGDTRPTAVERIRIDKFIDFPLWKHPSGPLDKQMEHIKLHRGQLYDWPCQNTWRHATSIHKAMHRREAEGITVHMNSFPALSPPMASTDRPPFICPLALILFSENCRRWLRAPCGRHPVLLSLDRRLPPSTSG